MGLGKQLAHAWNAFTNADTQRMAVAATEIGSSYGVRPDRVRIRVTNERSIISSIYTRMAIDIAQIDIRHVRVNDNEQYLEDIDSYLNDCLKTEANLDQDAVALLMDVVFTMFDSGVAAVVPIDTTDDPNVTGGYDVKTMRVGNIVQWYPQHVKVDVYNEQTGRREQVVVAKRNCAIVTNPLYAVMNEPNSTLQRLIRKLGLLDAVDEQSASGKLDMIIQLPYTIKTETKRQQAEARKKDIEFQMKSSQYGIAYVDATERITQLNRPAENNLMGQITMLTEMLYGQLGTTPEVMNGTADEPTMLNYQNRTVMPIIRAIASEYKRKFLTRTARTQGQDIQFFRDPFKLVPMKDIAEMADKFSRNEIFSANEIRGYMGVKPSDDPKANQLNNSNMPPVPDPNAAPPAPDPNATPPSVSPIDGAPIPVDGSTSGFDPSTVSGPFDQIDKVIEAAISGGPMPDITGIASDGDPTIMASALDEIDKAIDDAFSGFDLPEEAPTNGAS